MGEPEKKQTTRQAAPATGPVSDAEAKKIAAEWRKTGHVRAGFSVRPVTRGRVTTLVVERT